MEVAVPEEPQKKIFRARKTMKMSDRQQLEVLHNTLVSAGSNSSSPSSQPEMPLVNGTHTDDGQKVKETDKENGSKSPGSPMTDCSPPQSRSLSRSSSPAVNQSRNASPSPSLKKDSEKGEGDEVKEDEKEEMRPENPKDEKTELSKSVNTGLASPSDTKSDPKKMIVSNGELTMDTDGTSLDHVSAEEKSSKSSSSSPFGSPAASLECDPEVKEGFLCLSEEDEGQGEQDEVKEEKMEIEPVKKEAEKGCKAADGTGNASPVGKKRSLSPVEMNDECKDEEIKEEREGKRARVEGVQLEAQLELKITANAGSRLKLQKVVQQLVEERLRMLQLTVFDHSLQELKERVDKIDATTKQQNTVQHTLQSKIARLAKKFGAANQASENSKKAQEATAAAKAAPGVNTTPTTQRTVRSILDQKQSIVPPGSSSSTATPSQPKPLSTPTTPTSSALAAPAPILQIISTTTNSTPSSSSSSLSGQAQTGTLLLQPRPNAGGMSTNTATTAGQPVSIQPLLIQLPLAVANGQGGVGLIPVSSLASVSSISKAKTTTATTFILQKTPGNLVSSSTSTSLSSLPSTTVTQMPLNRTVYQGGTVTASSPSAGISVTTARAPTQSAAVVGMATVSSSPATTGPAATGSAAAASGPPSALEMTSKTDNQATNSTPAKSSAQPARPKGSVIDLTEDDDDVQVTSVQKAAAAASANPTTTQRAQGPTPSLVSSTSVARSGVQHRPSVDSPSKSRTNSSSATPLPPLPPAPAPPLHLLPDTRTSEPQQPQLKLARVQSQNGIVLSWCVSETERNCAPVDSYHLYAYHHDQQAASTTQSSSHSQWKKIGEVKALPLPMACTLTQFVSGSTYYFAVRAKDVYGRFGPFCEPQCTDVINPPTSSAS